MVDRNDDVGNLRPDKKQIEKPETMSAVGKEPASVKPPVPAARPALLKQPVPVKGPVRAAVPVPGPTSVKKSAVGSQPAEIRKDFSTGALPVQQKDEKPKPITPGKPLVIEPDEKEKPVMPGLKGEPGKKAVRTKKEKPVGKPLSRPRNRSLTFLLLVCLILLAGGAALLVLPTLDIGLPEWAEPVLELYRKIPLFPE
jgi:hypothetical protein